ncbi:MAG: hypothetical protein LBQ68_03960 [Clostridiales bacterium]|jgi:hypothetical protein|nr:hypothetical protein [Clostridiales bacterium]
MEVFQKVVALYKYTKELVALKYTVVTDIGRQLFSLSTGDIPEYENYVQLSFRDYTESDDDLPQDSSDVLLRIGKPDFYPCPEPSKELVQWLKQGWDNYRAEAEIFEELTIEGNLVF